MESRVFWLYTCCFILYTAPIALVVPRKAGDGHGAGNGLNTSLRAPSNVPVV